MMVFLNTGPLLYCSVLWLESSSSKTKFLKIALCLVSPTPAPLPGLSTQFYLIPL